MNKAARGIEYLGQIILVVGVMVGALMYVHGAQEQAKATAQHRQDNLKKWQAEWNKEATQNAYDEAARDIKAQTKVMGKGHACRGESRGQMPEFVLAHKDGSVKVERITTDKAFEKNSGYWLDSFCYVR